MGIAEHVDLVGFQKNPFSWMRRCDLYVMSSAWEGFGNVLAEALACGARIVSTDCRTGPREILEDGKWGTLVPVGDAEALAVAMEEGLDDALQPDAHRRTAFFRHSPSGLPLDFKIA
ncbi:MAG: glycosyltransferase [Alphaproteobacteria bacterium]